MCLNIWTDDRFSPLIEVFLRIPLIFGFFIVVDNSSPNETI